MTARTVDTAGCAQNAPMVRDKIIRPPTFVLFVNDEKLMHFAYQRYLENQFRKSFGFEGTPIRFILRNKNQKGDDVK